MPIPRLIARISIARISSLIFVSVDTLGPRHGVPRFAYLSFLVFSQTLWERIGNNPLGKG